MTPRRDKKLSTTKAEPYHDFVRGRVETRTGIAGGVADLVSVVNYVHALWSLSTVDRREIVTLAQLSDIAAYIEDRVPKGRQAKISFFVRDITIVNPDDSKLTAGVIDPHSFVVLEEGGATIHAPLPPNVRKVEALVAGRADPKQTGPLPPLIEGYYDRRKAAEEAVVKMHARVKAEMRPRNPHLPKVLLDELNAQIRAFLERTHSGGGGGGGGGNGAIDDLEPSDPDAQRLLNRDFVGPVVIDVPVPAADVGVASAGGSTASGDGASWAPPPDPVLRPKPVPRTGFARVVGDLLEGVAGAPPPIPPHPIHGHPPATVDVDAGALRDLDGKAIGRSDDELGALLSALVKASPALRPFVSRRGDRAEVWAQLLTAGWFRTRNEPIRPGDVLVVVDPAYATGAYDAIALTDGGGELLVAGTERFRVVPFPVTGRIERAWAPWPRWAFSDANPIGAFWGPETKRMKRLLADFYDTRSASLDELVAFLAKPLGSKARDVSTLMTEVGGLRLLTTETPPWPGSVVVGAGEDEIGVLLTDGRILGTCATTAWPTLVTDHHHRRFRPRYVLYPQLA